MNNPRTLAIFNLLGGAAVLTVNTLANTLPINGLNTGEVSRFYPNLFVPAGFTFSIWSVIYLLMLGFMALSGSGERITIKGADGKAVKQPVALDTDGSALPPGTKPLVINNGEGVDIYAQTDFGTLFGNPSIYPS